MIALGPTVVKDHNTRCKKCNELIKIPTDAEDGYYGECENCGKKYVVDFIPSTEIESDSIVNEVAELQNNPEKNDMLVSIYLVLEHIGENLHKILEILENEQK
jgi:hypothetical protein